jgi:predicted amidohydrolase
MKTSIIQFSPVLGDVSANTDKVNRLLDDTRQSKLVVLPELANSGYNFENREHALSLAEPVTNSAYIEMLVRHARKNKQYIVSGFHELAGELLFNTSVLVSGEGVIGKYRKVHLFMHEKEIFEPGNLGFPVFELEGFRLGMLICFDYLFSEAWRITGLEGADIMAHPSNLITGNALKMVPAQALSNRMFVVTANRTGTERELTFNGKSFAVNPAGDIISSVADDREIILTFNFDPKEARNKFVTPLNHVFEDRVPEQYTGLTRK